MGMDSELVHCDADDDMRTDEGRTGAKPHRAPTLRLAVQRVARAMLPARVKLLLLRYAVVDDRHFDTIVQISACIFHWLYRWDGYPRSLRKDIEEIRRLVAWPEVIRHDARVMSFLMLCSDPACIPWRQSAEPVMAGVLQGHDLSGAGDRRLLRSLIFFPAFFGGYLKRSGDLDSAERFYQLLVQRGFAAEGYFGLADISHLLANWGRELEEYRRGGILPYPFPVPRGYEKERLTTIEAYSHDRAIASYRRATEVAPEVSSYWLHLGRALLDLGELDEARKALERASKSQPSNALAAAYARLSALAGSPVHYSNLTVEHYPELPLPDRTAQLKKVKVVKAADLVTEAKASISLLDEMRLDLHYRRVVDGHTTEVRRQLVYPRVIAMSFSRLRDLGFGLKLASDKYLIADSKSMAFSEMKLFVPSLLMVIRDHALLAVSPGTRLRCQRIPVTLPGAPFNYYHWMFDCLGALAMLEQAVGLDDFEVLIHAPLTPWQEETLGLTLCDQPKLTLVSGQMERHELQNALHLPYASRLNVPHPAVVARLRERMSIHTSYPSPGKRIYLSRHRVEGRRTTNETAIREFLETWGFTTVDPGRMSFAEQRALFSDVEAIVAPAGAALSNLLFCPAQTKVVILTSVFHHHETYTALAAAIGLSCWLCMNGSVTKPNPYNVWSVFDHEAGLAELRVAIEESLGNTRNAGG
jgi:capsular polysaccharide biosynthesis protein/tetratricopeptide (TPR) repeat protein